jgi:hypothetical protein
MSSSFYSPFVTWVVLAVLMVEIGLLLYCRKAGQKYMGRVLAAALMLQLIWILGVVIGVFMGEIWLLVYCCGAGQKYAARIFAAGWALQLIWILGLIVHADWLFVWINIYFMMIGGLLLSFAGMMGVAVKRNFR